MNESRRWTPERVDELCDMIADGFSFDACAMALECKVEECERQFEKVRQRYGEQGR